MITIITRTSSRPDLFRRLRKYIQDQTIAPGKVYHMVLADNPDAYKYAFDELNQGVDVLKIDKLPLSCVAQVRKGSQNRGFYNLYLNEGIEMVTQGWILIVDDDDYLIDPECLQRVYDLLWYKDRFYLFQFARGSKIKPPENLFPERHYAAGDTTPIIRGKIGSSCIVVHADMAKKARWDDNLGADYRYIRDLALQFPYSFYPIPVVQATITGNKGKNIHQ